MFSKIMLASCFFLLIYALAYIGANRELGCARRVHVARAEQQDEFGRRCWDFIKFTSCGGWCDSSEVADWEFPYKISRHPVCVHGARRQVSLRLRHCDPGIERGTDLYHYVAAENCHCQKCSSESTSCEWLPPNSTLMGLNTEVLDSDIYTVNALA